MKCFDNEEPKIIYCDNHVLVALKPAGWLTQPDGGDRPSLEEFCKEWVKKEYHKPGAVFLHAIHRLDRPVLGLVLFARTSKALSRLNVAVRSQDIQRTYAAEVEGIPQEKMGRLEHFLIHEEHRAVVSDRGEPAAKRAVLTYEVKEIKERTTSLTIYLETGRYHQIRAQLAAIGHPIVGDRKYGAKSGNGEKICLYCIELVFTHPVTKERLTFNMPI